MIDWRWRNETMDEGESPRVSSCGEVTSELTKQIDEIESEVATAQREVQRIDRARCRIAKGLAPASATSRRSCIEKTGWPFFAKLTANP